MPERVLHIRAADIFAVRVWCGKCQAVIEREPSAFASAGMLVCPSAQCGNVIRQSSAPAEHPLNTVIRALSAMEGHGIELVVRDGQ
jgi:hypothetical protein